jgi:hypothetical protein
MDEAERPCNLADHCHEIPSDESEVAMDGLREDTAIGPIVIVRNTESMGVSRDQGWAPDSQNQQRRKGQSIRSPVE